MTRFAEAGELLRASPDLRYSTGFPSAAPVAPVAAAAAAAAPQAAPAIP
jgi:hypothetical protein